jgi:hypothetical protein
MTLDKEYDVAVQAVRLISSIHFISIIEKYCQIRIARLFMSWWECMKDWECMTDLLMEDPGPGEESLDDEQETSLIELMIYCIEQAATGKSPCGRAPTRKVTATYLLHAHHAKTIICV